MLFVANSSLPHLIHPTYLEWGTVTEMGLAFATSATVLFTEIAQSYLSLCNGRKTVMRPVNIHSFKGSVKMTKTFTEVSDSNTYREDMPTGYTLHDHRSNTEDVYKRQV